jgi:zinc protease
VVLTAFRAGGTHRYINKEYPSALVAANLVRSSGIASLTDTEFQDWLKNEKRKGDLSIYPYISADEEGFEGQSSLNKSDQLFQLLYLYATQPRADKNIFNKKFTLDPAKAKTTPSNAKLFEDSVQHVIAGNSNTGPIGAAQFDKAFHIYKERFSNASGFTFVITGYFETEDIIKKVVRWLGALPGAASTVLPLNDKKSEPVKPLVINPDLRVTMIDDATGEATVKLFFTGKLDATVRNQLIVNVARNVLTTVLYYRLREQEKGVYFANVGMNILRDTGKLSLRIEFNTAPENVDRLVAAAREELYKIAEGKLSDDIFASALAAEKPLVAPDLKSANYVNTYIADQLRKKTMSLDGMRRREILEQVTKEDVISLLRDALNKDHYMLFKLTWK